MSAKYVPQEQRVYERLGWNYHPMMTDVLDSKVICALDVVLTRLDALEARMQQPDTIVEAVARPVLRCEACAEGRHCERLQQLVEAAWRHGETAANG